MKKIFTFNTRMLNGTVTMGIHTDAFSTRELAEKARVAVVKANIEMAVLNGGMEALCDEVEEVAVYDTEDEVPILKNA